jgi:excisionase family DNA binding protein
MPNYNKRISILDSTRRGLLTIEQVALLTGWSPATVRSKVYKRELEFVKLGRSVRFRPETIEQLITDSVIPAIA